MSRQASSHGPVTTPLNPLSSSRLSIEQSRNVFYGVIILVDLEHPIPALPGHGGWVPVILYAQLLARQYRVEELIRDRIHGHRRLGKLPQTPQSLFKTRIELSHKNAVVLVMNFGNP